MSRKRRNTSSAEPDGPSSRHHQLESSSEVGLEEDSDQSEQPQIDTKTGLTGAFPGLTNDNDIFYGPANDGLDYLRMVRTEASSIPQYLTAPKVLETYDVQNDISEGFYDEDEAFIATPLQEESAHHVSKAQSVYYDSILAQLSATRTKLRATPPLNAIQALPKSMLISFPAASKPARLMWEAYIRQHAPHPVQIACMDSDSILAVIQLLTKKMRMFLQSSEEQDIDRMGAWLWAVLAQCPDRGQLGSEEISDLRAFAKAADATWHWLHDRVNGTAPSNYVREVDAEIEGKNIEDETSDDDSSMHKLGAAGHVENSDTYLLEKHQIILDIIITVVGETYGQRDLLALRRPWALGDDV